MAKRRPSIYEFAGGAEAFLALAAATHERCLQDPELNHPFSHTSDPNHLEHLAAYWAEALGGPARYSESLGGQPAMLTVHAGQGSAPDFPQRFTACFMQGVDDASRLHFSDGALTRAQHEMIASYVSALNRCRY